jgi:hypothetical protein
MIKSIQNGSLLLASITALALLTSACGGGSSGTPGAANPPAAAANVFPSVDPTVGDYVVLQETVTAAAGTTLPTPSVYSFARTYTASSPIARIDFDSRSDGPSLNFLKSNRSFDIDGKEITSTTAGVTCTYAPALATFPAKGALPNSSFSSSSVKTCSASGAGLTTDNITITGTAVGLEDVTVPAGTFKAFKYTSTRITRNATNQGTSVGTFWVDTVSGRTIKYVTNLKGIIIATGASTADLTYTTEMVAYRVLANNTGFASAKSFSGGWTVAFTGSAAGVCNLTVTASGAMSGQCNGNGGSPSASGGVSDAGALSVLLSDGTRITGSLSSPSAGSGTWANGTATGTWTASHK